MKTLFVFIFVMQFIFAVSTNATVQKLSSQEHKTSKTRTDDKKVDTDNLLNRFQQHGANQLFFKYKDAEEFHGHMDANISVRYLLTKQPKLIENITDSFDYSIFLTYSGEFDFFYDSRYSGPVENRRFNPGIHVATTFKKYTGFIEGRMSFEHESNGQDVDEEGFYTSVALDTYRKNREDGMALSTAYGIAKESTSRESNFLSIGGVYRLNGNKEKVCDDLLNCIDFHFKLREVVGDVEDDVFSVARDGNDYVVVRDSSYNLIDYQGIEISIDTNWTWQPLADGGNVHGLTLTYRTGQMHRGSPFQNNTFDLSYYFNWDFFNLDKPIVIPIVVKYHYGYMEELYNFHEKSSYTMVGIHFRY